MVHEMNLFGVLSPGFELGTDWGNRGRKDASPVVIDKSINQLGKASSWSRNRGKTGGDAVLSFDGKLEVGTTVEIGAQVFELIAVLPHVRQDGETSSLLEWKAQCPVCQSEFVQKTAAKVRWFTRRCPMHKRPGSKVKACGERTMGRFDRGRG